MKRATLPEVGQRAFTDANFWKALRKDPESALEKADMELSPAKLRELKRLLKRNVLEVDLDALMKEVHRAQSRAGTTPSWRSWRIWRSWLTWHTWRKP